MTSPIVLPRVRFFTSAGAPAAGYKLRTYIAGTTTDKATYSDYNGSTPNTNPIILDADGEATVYLADDVAYKFVLLTSADVTEWTEDNVSSIQALTMTRLISSASASTGAGLVGFEYDLAYAADTVGKKLKDTYSTSDASTLAAAVAAAYSAGAGLHFPTGTIVSAATIPNFHDVRKTGFGSVTRGSDVFYVTPSTTQTNRLYVATTGDDANDGLSSSQPLATLQKALDILGNYPRVPNGLWEIICAAGTYNEGAVDMPENFRGTLTIRGPVVNHPNVPTAIFDGTTGTQVYWLNCNRGDQVTVSNIKAQDYTGYGIVGQDLSDITTINFHAANISTTADAAGVKCQQGRLRVGGGIFTSCRNGVLAIGGAVYTVGDGAVSLATGTQFSACTEAGVLVQDGATGHVDYCTIDNCAVGVDVATNGKANVTSGDIKNNTTAGLRASTGGQVLDNGNTFTANAINEVVRSQGGELGRQVAWVDVARVSADTSLTSHTGTTSATNVRTFSSAIKNASFVWSGRSLWLEASGGITGTAGDKTFTLRIGSTDAVSVTIPAAQSGAFVVRFRLQAVDATNQRARAEAAVTGNAAVAAVANSTVNMSSGSALDVHLRVTLANSADTVQPTLCELWQTA